MRPRSDAHTMKTRPVVMMVNNARRKIQKMLVIDRILDPHLSERISIYISPAVLSTKQSRSSSQPDSRIPEIVSLPQIRLALRPMVAQTPSSVLITTTTWMLNKLQHHMDRLTAKRIVLTDKRS